MMIAILFILVILFFPYLFFRKGTHPHSRQHYDAMLILGCPTHDDGNITSAQNKRLALAEKYLSKQIVDAVIISGAAVKNEYIEAEVMKAALQKKGVTTPIYTEVQARNTFQNFRNTRSQFGDLSLLVVTGSAHSRRSYFFARKFYTHEEKRKAKHDPVNEYVREYFRMWNALYWEVKLFLQKQRF